MKENRKKRLAQSISFLTTMITNAINTPKMALSSQAGTPPSSLEDICLDCLGRVVVVVVVRVGVVVDVNDRALWLVAVAVLVPPIVAGTGSRVAGRAHPAITQDGLRVSAGGFRGWTRIRRLFSGQGRDCDWRGADWRGGRGTGLEAPLRVDSVVLSGSDGWVSDDDNNSEEEEEDAVGCWGWGCGVDFPSSSLYPRLSSTGMLSSMLLLPLLALTPVYSSRSFTSFSTSPSISSQVFPPQDEQRHLLDSLASRFLPFSSISSPPSCPFASPAMNALIAHKAVLIPHAGCQLSSWCPEIDRHISRFVSNLPLGVRNRNDGGRSG